MPTKQLTLFPAKPKPQPLKECPPDLPPCNPAIEECPVCVPIPTCAVPPCPAPVPPSYPWEDWSVVGTPHLKTQFALNYYWHGWNIKTFATFADLHDFLRKGQATMDIYRIRGEGLATWTPVDLPPLALEAKTVVENEDGRWELVQPVFQPKIGHWVWKVQVWDKHKQYPAANFTIEMTEDEWARTIAKQKPIYPPPTPIQYAIGDWVDYTEERGEMIGQGVVMSMDSIAGKPGVFRLQVAFLKFADTLEDTSPVYSDEKGLRLMEHPTDPTQSFKRWPKIKIAQLQAELAAALVEEKRIREDFKTATWPATEQLKGRAIQIGNLQDRLKAKIKKLQVTLAPTPMEKHTYPEPTAPPKFTPTEEYKLEIARAVLLTKAQGAMSDAAGAEYDRIAAKYGKHRNEIINAVQHIIAPKPHFVIIPKTRKIVDELFASGRNFKTTQGHPITAVECRNALQKSPRAQLFCDQATGQCRVDNRAGGQSCEFTVDPAIFQETRLMSPIERQRAHDRPKSSPGSPPPASKKVLAMKPTAPPKTYEQIMAEKARKDVKEIS